jgi:hypothetical protein
VIVHVGGERNFVPADLVVGGTLSPDATGTYHIDGLTTDYTNGGYEPTWGRGDGWVVRWATTWCIDNDGVSGWWNGSSVQLAGNYSPYSVATGTATVTIP